MMDNFVNESLVYCNECEKQEWCAIRQYMKYGLGIENGYCAAGEKKNDE